MTSLSRRKLLLGGLSLLAASSAASADDVFNNGDAGYYDPDLLPPPESEIDFPIVPVDPKGIKKRYRRQEVEYEGDKAPGTVIVDPGHRFLYYVTDYGTATRFGVGFDVKVSNGLVMRWSA